MVAAGILLSRIIGLVRNRVFAHYFGTSMAADAFNAAFRIPNFLQNLFGEGVLSASLIPVYAGLRAGGRTREAAAVATAVASLLGLAVSLLVLAGVLLAPWLIDLIAPGFEGEKRDLTVRLVRILFPGAGLLALSAWCLGVLNSHRRFFLSYVAPVLWNVAIIAALVGFGSRRTQADLAVVAAWGSVAGSLLQLLFQLPTVLRVLDGLRPGPLLGPGSRTVLRNFGPVFVGRGVVQISAYVDTLLASLLPTGAVAAVSYAQVLYTLPVSLFGMSVSAAELPEMSSATGTVEERAAHLRARLESGLRQIAFLVVPSTVGFIALGDVVTGALYQSGEFTRPMTLYVWGILAAASVGLLPSTLGRLYSSAFYAMHDTRTPLRIALVRVSLGMLLGYVLALHLPRALGLSVEWGAAGITLASGLAAGVEYALLRAAVARRIGATRMQRGLVSRLWLAAGLAGATGWMLRAILPPLHPITLAGLVLAAFALVYFGVGAATGVPEARALLRRVSP
ncbi:MAG TPA: murein biosynthesis integral membrane protein MurJ [Gemmatimonadales bacterium]|nr:murein biosynthesis integral membrane protein MurJ [Gemmatimonadales bacterium]